MTLLDLHNFHNNGFLILPVLLDPSTVDTMLDALANTPDLTSAYGARDLLRRVPLLREIASSTPIRNVIEQVLSPTAFPVRGLLFDKTLEANWKVPWHQDLTIAVRERREIPGFGPWSIKSGIPHVQPPTEILQSMATLRIHLDNCDESNGPLHVLPGAHAYGILASEEIAKHRQTTKPMTCPIPRGGALLMRPLLPHASSSAASPNHRRVVHIEFADTQLPGGLQWEEA